MFLHKDSILMILKETYRKDLKQFENYLNDNFKIYGDIYAIKLNQEHSIEDLFNYEKRFYESIKREFFYDRKSSLVIKGIRWHEDFSDNLYNFLEEDLAFKNGYFGFLSSVSPYMLYSFSMDFNEKIFFKEYLRPEY